MLLLLLLLFYVGSYVTYVVTYLIIQFQINSKLRLNDYESKNLDQIRIVTGSRCREHQNVGIRYLNIVV